MERFLRVVGRLNHFSNHAVAWWESTMTYMRRYTTPIAASAVLPILFTLAACQDGTAPQSRADPQFRRSAAASDTSPPHILEQSPSAPRASWTY